MLFTVIPKLVQTTKYLITIVDCDQMAFIDNIISETFHTNSSIQNFVAPQISISAYEKCSMEQVKHLSNWTIHLETTSSSAMSKVVAHLLTKPNFRYVKEVAVLFEEGRTIDEIASFENNFKFNFFYFKFNPKNNEKIMKKIQNRPSISHILVISANVNYLTLLQTVSILC